MTELQKDILIAKMLDDPSGLSDKEIEMILEDEELGEIYEVSSAVCGACLGQPEIDMDNELKLLRRRMLKRPSFIKIAMRVAAAVSIGVVATITAVWLYSDFISHKSDQRHIAKTEQKRIMPPISSKGPEVTAIDDNGAPAIAPLPDDNNISADIKEGKKKTAPEAERYGPAIEEDEYLRIERARIENDIAMQMAAVYEDELYYLYLMADSFDPDDYEIEPALKHITAP